MRTTRQVQKSVSSHLRFQSRAQHVIARIRLAAARIVVQPPRIEQLEQRRRARGIQAPHAQQVFFGSRQARMHRRMLRSRRAPAREQFVGVALLLRGGGLAADRRRVERCATRDNRGRLADLRERAVRFEQIEAERAALQTDGDDPLAALRAEHESTRARLTAERETLAARRREREASLTAARQHAADTSTGAHKTGFFARLLGMGKSAADPAEVERHAAELDSEIKELAAHEAKLAGECDQSAAAFAADCDRVRESRRSEHDTKLAALTGEADAATAAFRGHRAAFEAAGFAAPWPTAHSVDTAHAALDAARAAAERDLIAARDRAAEPSRSRADVVREFLAGVRVVVGTPGCLHADAVFAPPSEPTPPFGFVPGAPPRTSTAANVEDSHNSTVQPVAARRSVQWPTRMPGTSVMAFRRPGCQAAVTVRPATRPCGAFRGRHPEIRARSRKSPP